MPTLSERDLSSVEKFSNAMQAALAVTKKRHSKHKQCQQEGMSKPQRQQDCGDDSLPLTNSEATLAEERRVWAETAFVFWRIASRQQLHLMQYITADATGELCLVCDGLLDYIHASFDMIGASASFESVMHRASLLAADHIFFFLDAFCALHSCVRMTGGEEAAGRALHSHVCRALVQRGHFHWMTRVFCAFCDASRHFCAARVGVSAAFVSAARESLLCLRHCCADSAACARGLIYTEPRPLVASLMHGLRLRIAAAALIRPFVFEEAAAQSESRETEREDLTRVPRGRQAVAAFLAKGRSHIYDEVCQEALAVAITAAERATAFDSPALITALCLIMELSSRAIHTPTVQTSGDANRARASESAALSMSGQVAMYENIISALDALRQLLRAPHECGKPGEMIARREAVMQQLCGYDLAGCVRVVLRYCPMLVSSDDSFLNVVCRFCLTLHTISTSVIRTPLHGLPQHFGAVPGLHKASGNDSASSDRGMNTGSLSESTHTTRESESQLLSSQSAKGRRTSGRKGSITSPKTSSRKSLWKTFWGGSTRGEHQTRANCSAEEDELVIKNESPISPAAFEPLKGELESFECANMTCVSIARAIVSVLNDAFMDTASPTHLCLSLCGYLTSMTMRTNSAFSAFDGRIVLRSFLQVLRFQLLCSGSHETAPTGPLTPPVLESDDSDETLAKLGADACKTEQPKHENDQEGGEENKEQEQEGVQQMQWEPVSAREKEILRTALAQRIAEGLSQAYHALHEPPLPSEVADLVELPFVLLRWKDSHGMLPCLLGHVMRLWLTGLTVADAHEDITKRSYEVLMEVFAGLAALGSLPVNSGSGGAVTGGTTGAEDICELSVRDPAVHSDNESTACGEAEQAITTVLNTSLDEMGTGCAEGTIIAIKDIFTILLQRSARILSVGMLEVLFSLLKAGDSYLLRLGQRCITSSLDFGDVYAAYAEVIRDAEPSLLLQLLPLFSSELSSSAISAYAKRERRIWFFSRGCIDSVITFIDRVLRNPHNVPSFSVLIQKLFRFLSVFESAQGSSPRLFDTQLTKVFADAIVSLDGAENLIYIAQAVLDAATSKYDYGRTYSPREQSFGHFTLSMPNCSAEKTIFLELIPPLLYQMERHAPDIASNLTSVLYFVLKATANVRSDGLLEWVLKTRQTKMLPYLELDEAILDQLPYVGTKNELQSFWPPILYDEPKRSEVRFNCVGGIVVTLGEWPEKGFSISTYFRFEEIYSNMCLFEFFGKGIGEPPPSSLHIVGGDSVHFLQHGKKTLVNENHALQGLAPGQWIHVIVVMSVVHTVSVYYNATKIGACSLPYFRPRSEVVINIGSITAPIREGLFSIGSVELWDEELTMPQVEAHLATTSYQPYLCKLLPCEVPRELSEIRADPPMSDRIAHFVPHGNGDVLLHNFIPTATSCPIVAKLTGNYVKPPKVWIDFRALFISRGGLRHLLDWVGQAGSADELERFVALACNCIRTTTSASTLNARTYMLLGFFLRTNAALITPAVCESLIHLATAKRSVNDDFHPVVINRFVFDHIFNDIELLGSMPVDVAAYLLEKIERIFSSSFCRFAKHNASFVVAFRFVDSILNCLVYSPVILPFVIRVSLVSCIKQLMIACDFETNVVSAMLATVAVLTPEAVALPNARTATNTPLELSALPVQRFPEIRVAQNVACDIALLILRSLVDCCGSNVFATALGCTIDLNWFAVCTSRFADGTCVVYATRLFLEALQVNTELRNVVMQHPTVVIEALSMHRINEELLLLLLSHSLGMTSRIDVLSSKHPLLEQLGGILNSVSPQPDAVMTPILFKLITLHLSGIMTTPVCFRPSSISTVMQRRKHYASRVYRYFNFVRICARLVISIYAKNRMRQSGQEQQQLNPSLPSLKATPVEESLTHKEQEVDLEKSKSDLSDLCEKADVNTNELVSTEKLTLLMRRYRRVWSALFVCVRLWCAIGRQRYRSVKRRTTAECVGGVEIAMTPATKANGTFLVLQTLQRLIRDPKHFEVLTSSPYQIASLAIFGTYISKDVIDSAMEEIQRQEWTTKMFSLPMLLHPPVHSCPTVPHPLVFPEMVNATHSEEDPKSLCVTAPLLGEKGEAKSNETPEENVEEKLIPPLTSPLLSSESSFSFASSVCSARDEDAAPNRLRDVPRPPESGALSMRSSADASEADDAAIAEIGLNGDALAMAADEAMMDEQMKSCAKQRESMLQLLLTHASLGDLLRKTAVDILRCAIFSALHTNPIRTGWVGGEAYGCCGGLLFQVMFISNTVSGGAEDTATLTNFFTCQVLEVVEMANILCQRSDKVKRQTSASTSMASLLLLNVCRFNDLLVDMVSFDVMELPSFAPYFLCLLAKCGSWPEHCQHQLRAQVVESCIAVLNRPSLQDITAELMNTVYTLLSHAMCAEWIMTDMLECLLRVLFRVYISLPPTCMDNSVVTRRKNFAVFTLRKMVLTYLGKKDLYKALSARTLTQRFSFYKELTNIFMKDSAARIFALFESFCRDNVTAIDTLMSGRPKTKTDNALKLLLKGRSEYIKRIKAFNAVYTKTTNVSGEYRVTELIKTFNTRFSSSIGSISPIKCSQLHCLMFQECSLEQQEHYERNLRFSNQGKRDDSVNVSMTTPIEPQSHSLIDGIDGSTNTASASEDGMITAERCEHQLNHISALVLPFAVRCRPYIDLRPSFVDQRCKVTPSAITLLRYLLEPNEVVHFIINGFRINGIHATPCLILLTTRALKVIGFSRITEKGDILLCHYNNGEDLANQELTIESTDRTVKHKKSQQQTAISFALSVTNKLQRFLSDDGRRKKETEARKDGTKLAESVRQATGHSGKDLFWVYRLSNITSVRAAYYMHQDTALLFDLAYDNGPLLSIVDAQQSMNTLARDELLRVLRLVLGNSRCNYHEHSQRGKGIRSMLIRWAAGSISTFDYLNFLNQMAGRTEKDFNQYPVYPWVLADYKSEELALDDPATYRNLSLPMAAQTELRQQSVKKQYDQMIEMKEMDEEEGQGHHGNQPFHHGAHYSTSGGVLYYLIRIEPFTTFARIFQGGEFDLAARLFDSIEASFQSCVSGPTDCKELIPEFFSNGMFLLNKQHWNFGEKPDGSIVNDVKLPPWAKGSTQVFTAVMRYVLESSAVVNSINRWIDLIFGVRRRGNLAEKSYNIFQRMTYGEEVIKALKESNSTHEINVIIAEVDNFGQTPMQLFQERHPAQRELEPVESSSSGGGGGGGSSGSGGHSGSGHSYTLAFNECTPRVLPMIMHALDSPNMWYSVTDPPAGSFQAFPSDLCEAFCISESSVIGFATIRTGGKLMCCYKYFTLVNDTDDVICLNEERKLMRYDALTGELKSLIRYTSPVQGPISVTAVCVGIRETLILLGSHNGTVCCLLPTSEDGLPLLNFTLCHHTNPIAGFATNEHLGRVISFTSTGTDFPIVWQVHRPAVQKLHRLNLSDALPHVTSGELIVVAAFIDPRTANSVLITRRHLILFDVNGDLFGLGALPLSAAAPPHLEDERGEVGLSIDRRTAFVASMTAVATFDAPEWASGIQLVLTGHQDGSLSLWRAARLPPEKVAHGRIARVEHHGVVFDGAENPHLGAVTAIQQEEKDVPTFLLGFHSGAVKVLSFAEPPTEGAKSTRST